MKFQLLGMKECRLLNSNQNLRQGKPKDLVEAVKQAVTIELALHDPSLSTSGKNSTPDPYAMDIDATRTGNGKTRDEFLKRMRGRCFGCGSADHVKGNCSWKGESCRYCGRAGHLEQVCQDKFMGLERNRGNSQRNPRQQVAASFGTWSLFDDSPPSATPPPAIPNANVDFLAQINAMKEAMAQQNTILAAFMKQKDF
jgi:hypothetical protein